MLLVLILKLVEVELEIGIVEINKIAFIRIRRRRRRCWRCNSIRSCGITSRRRIIDEIIIEGSERFIRLSSTVSIYINISRWWKTVIELLFVSGQACWCIHVNSGAAVMIWRGRSRRLRVELVGERDVPVHLARLLSVEVEEAADCQAYSDDGER